VLQLADIEDATATSAQIALHPVDSPTWKRPRRRAWVVCALGVLRRTRREGQVLPKPQRRSWRFRVNSETL
jgi:hypothetical protein